MTRDSLHIVTFKISRKSGSDKVKILTMMFYGCVISVNNLRRFLSSCLVSALPTSDMVYSRSQH